MNAGAVSPFAHKVPAYLIPPNKSRSDLFQGSKKCSA